MKALPGKLCGKPFGEKELSVVKKEIENADPFLRSEIARRVCRALDWVDITGKPKLMSARVGLLRLYREGFIELPTPRNGNGNKTAMIHDDTELPDVIELTGTVGDLTGLRLEIVEGERLSRIFNALVQKYHYLGYRPLPGAQIRYLIKSEEGILGAISFGGAAWKVAARDNWIGWDARTRERNLPGIINNTRFLILPWVKVKNLASRVLCLCVKRLKEDMPVRYGYCPVLLETFVDKERFEGTCYRAANWLRLGQTKGRGKHDRHHRAAIAVKDIYVYPLKKNFQKSLGVAV
jgi:hypothetical protein